MAFDNMACSALLQALYFPITGYFKLFIFKRLICIYRIKTVNKKFCKVFKDININNETIIIMLLNKQLM